MGSLPPVSICLTTYNRAPVLPGTIGSLLAQSFSDFELIIQDDCSPDETEAICRKYQERDHRIKYFRNHENLRMPGNLNAAIRRATGKYIANVHDGDSYRPDLIEKWKRALDEVPEAAFVFNDYEWISKDGKRTLHRLKENGRMDGKKVALHFFNTFSSCVWGTVMARRNAYEGKGLFNPSYGFISDVDMWLRLAHGNDVAYVPEPLIILTPRETNHPFAFVNWRHHFWTLGMYVDHLKRYESIIPMEVARFTKEYPSRRRSFFLRDMAICIKHSRWDRAREGFAILRDADDIFLKSLGHCFGNHSYLPDWYDPSSWSTCSVR
ncbi:MAG: glycosyltransferase family 2 protein [Anaerolineales bacterium]|nr:glycosyltransferase family 2 protein [Anaerolineales bacterium]